MPAPAGFLVAVSTLGFLSTAALAFFLASSAFFFSEPRLWADAELEAARPAASTNAAHNTRVVDITPRG